MLVDTGCLNVGVNTVALRATDDAQINSKAKQILERDNDCRSTQNVESYCEIYEFQDVSIFAADNARVTSDVYQKEDGNNDCEDPICINEPGNVEDLGNGLFIMGDCRK